VPAAAIGLTSTSAGPVSMKEQGDRHLFHSGRNFRPNRSRFASIGRVICLALIGVCVLSGILVTLRVIAKTKRALVQIGRAGEI
jgi:hypothetical protein